MEMNGGQQINFLQADFVVLFVFARIPCPPRTAGMNGEANRVEALKSEDAVGYDAITLDTPPLAAGSFI